MSADAILTSLEAGELPLCALIWVGLMQGSGDPGNIERWKQLVLREQDPEKRAAYRYCALTFAELIPELVNWQSALEGFDVLESQLSKTIEAMGERKGELRGRRAALLEGLEIRFGGTVPEPIRLAIEGTNDINTIDRWFRRLFTANSWDEFQAQMKQP